jgi:hypothetical protein
MGVDGVADRSGSFSTAIGVAVMFIPGSLLFHLVTGTSAIACGLIVLAMGADRRRRFRRASSA